jgi:hypothetical protein
MKSSTNDKAKRRRHFLVGKKRISRRVSPPAALSTGHTNSDNTEQRKATFLHRRTVRETRLRFVRRHSDREEREAEVTVVSFSWPRLGPSTCSMPTGEGNGPHAHDIDLGSFVLGWTRTRRVRPDLVRRRWCPLRRVRVRVRVQRRAPMDMTENDEPLRRSLVRRVQRALRMARRRRRRREQPSTGFISKNVFVLRHAA